MVNNSDITETAFYMFAVKGFHETSMEDIATVLGLKKQSLYSHFKSKNEIIIAVLQTQSDRLNSEIKSHIAQYCDQSVEQLMKLIFVRLSLHFSHRERLLLWKRIPLYTDNEGLGDTLQKLIADHDDSVHQMLTALLTERYHAFRDPESLRNFLNSFFVMVQGHLDHILKFGYSNYMTEQIWDNFWFGMKTQIEQATGQWGEPVETRKFHPHLTLGRVREVAAPRARQVGEALQATAVGALGEWRTEQVLLMRSQLSPHGATHSLVVAAPLG
jgi:AcrR family transcriptional regulator